MIQCVLYNDHVNVVIRIESRQIFYHSELNLWELLVICVQDVVELESKRVYIVNVKLFLLASDASAKTEKEIRFFAGALPVRKLPFDMDSLKCYFRKRTAVFGVCEDGFAAKMLLLLPESEE